MQINTKLQSVLASHILHLSKKFHQDSSTTVSLSC